MDELGKIVADVFQIDPIKINKNSSPETIDTWDSLAQLSLIISIEQHYKITLEIEEIFSIMKVGDIYEILRKKGVL